MSQTFDYVIVGGGSAGAVLAARLSEDSTISVCLLEAGGKSDHILVRTPGLLASLVRGKPKMNNWAFESNAQSHANNRLTYHPRGKGLGGSSGINAMLYIRGQREDYDHWKSLGCDGWGYDDLLPYFLKSENNERGKNEHHNDTGPLHVSDQSQIRSATQDFIDGAKAQGIPENDDFNDGEQEGIGLYQVTQFHSGAHKGERCSTYAAYLRPILKQRPNLTVLTRAQAERVIFEGKRAVGVEYRRGSKRQTVRAQKEVLLCAGAIQSPQLLMLSGVGDQAELAKHNIPLVAHNPNVGKNLQDHLDFTLMYRAKDADYIGFGFRGIAQMVGEMWRYTTKGTGLWRTPCAEGAGFVKTEPELDRPDIQFHFLITMAEEHGRNLHWGYGFGCHCCVLRPKSRGTVSLASANPKDHPIIDPNYLSEPDDLEGLLKGTKIMRRVIESGPLKQRIKSEFYTENARSDDELREAIKAHSETIYHPVGTCMMGSGDDAVVDVSLNVNGVTGLRVIDASIMPTLISGNTNAPTIAIAEKMADEIKQGHNS